MSHDKANQSEVGEGPKAVDAALRRFVREAEALETETPKTETPEAEATSDIESVEALLGDLELGADEATSTVVETIGELDDAAEDAAKTLELAIAEITKLGETDPKAADAALQRMAREREAREAKAFEAKYPADDDGLVLGDLEVGAGETSEVIEDIGELDSAGKGTLANAEAQDTLDEERREPTKLQVQMRATRARLNGGIDVASDDPLATDKIKIAKALKKVGRTLADLPPDWDKLPRISKIPFERSRQSELYRVFGEGEEEMREAERLRELEKRGRPANYDLLPVDERNRINGNIRQRKHRDEKRKPASKLMITPLPVAQIATSDLRSTLIAMRKSLEKWVVNYSTPLSRQLRKPEKQLAIIKAAAAYARYFNQHGEIPSQVALAKWLHCSKDQARRRLDRLKSLYAPGGPWTRA